MVSIIHDPRVSPVPWELPPKKESLNSFPAAWELLIRVVLDASVLGLAVC